MINNHTTMTELHQYGGSSIFARIERDELTIAHFTNGTKDISLDIPVTGRIVQSKLFSIYVIPDEESVERIRELCGWIGAVMVYNEADANVTPKLKNSLFINNKNPDDEDSPGINYIKVEYPKYSELNIQLSSSDADTQSVTSPLEKKNFLKSQALVRTATFVAHFRKVFLVSQMIKGKSNDQLIASINVKSIHFDSNRVAAIPFYNITGVRTHIRTGSAEPMRRIRINLKKSARENDKKTRDLLRKQMVVMSVEPDNPICQVINYNYAEVRDSHVIQEPKLDWNPYDVADKSAEVVDVDMSTVVDVDALIADVQGAVQVVPSLKEMRKKRAQ